jgi:serine/threonine protein kinase
LLFLLFSLLAQCFPLARCYSVGAYREAYISRLPNETVVFKAFYWGASFNYEDFEYMRMDAIVSEKLTWSPLIVDIYGFCGTGMINEAMEKGTLKQVAVPTGAGRLGYPLDPNKELEVRNTLNESEKLSYALQMAEGVRVLHSYPDGVIVHDDIQLSQFLLDAYGTLKLNDFNRAEIMLWNDKDKEYCRYRNNPGHGDVSLTATRCARPWKANISHGCCSCIVPVAGAGGVPRLSIERAD